MLVTRFCVGSGMCAAAASVVGKLATDPSLLLLHVLAPDASQQEAGSQHQDQRCNNQQGCPSHLSDLMNLNAGSAIRVSVQALLFLLMILINSFMWTLYSKALSLSRSGTEATVMNMAFNFLFTGIFSCLVFGEQPTARSIFASCLMLMGLLVLQIDQQRNQKQQERKGQEETRRASDGRKGGTMGMKKS